MNFEIAIALQLFDNFSRQLFQAKESLDRFNKGLAESQNRLKSLSEIMKKPLTLRQSGRPLRRWRTFQHGLHRQPPFPLQA